MTDSSCDIRATCPLCGTEYGYPGDILTRGHRLCPTCGATGRSSAIVLLTCRAIYGNDLPLARQPVKKSARVVGLSDAQLYAKPFASHFTYTNTYYHQPPKLDVRDPAPEFRDCADLVINSEVFEHVIGATQSAFDGIIKVLKPGGTMVFSVPFTNRKGSEHYPGLVDYTSRQTEDGGWAADLVFDDGHTATDLAPKFHGGPGLTLELRLFSRQRILDEMTAAGFTDVTFHEAEPQFGVNWGRFSLMVTARRPGTLARPRSIWRRLFGRG